MADRTTEAKVRAVIDADNNVSMAQFITTANALTDFVVTKDTVSILNAALLLEIETYLAAHYYHGFDQQVAQETIGDASATYQGKTDMRLDSSYWGQQAIALDVSGILSLVSKGSTKLRLEWLGTTKAAALDYWERN